MLKKILYKIKINHDLLIKNNSLLRSKKLLPEDIIIEKILKKLKINKKGFYVDVGCNHPVRNNNTFLLYKKGWEGVNIDISKFSIDLFNYARPKDVNIAALISNKKKFIKLYYQKEFSVLNTTIKSLAKQHFNNWFLNRKVKATTLNSILSKSRFNNKQIDFLNIDVEGGELNVLKSLNFKYYKPKVICIEILSLHYSKDKKKLFKNNVVVKFLIKKKYKKIWSCKYYRNHIFIKK